MIENTAETALWACMYVSSGFPGLTFADLDQILAASRVRNAAEGISGVLLFGGGNFLQYFEGPQRAVEALRARLSRDPRHHDIRVMLHDPIERRSFSAWQMGFLSGESAQLRAGYSALAEDPSLRARLAEAHQPLETVMLHFHENMR